jgi:hypothetical protein
MRHLDFEFFYGIDSYEKDIKAAPTERPQKGAWFAAAAKRYKRAVAIGFVEYVISRENIDPTPTLVRNLMKSLFKRGAAQDALFKFSTEGRTAADKSADHVRISDIAAKYEPAAAELLKTVNAEMKAVRRRYS